MLFTRSTQAERQGSGRIFYLCNPFRGNVQILHRLQYCLQLKNFTVPWVAWEKADPCKVLAVQKFVKGVWVFTRVGTFSVILITGFLFVYWCGCERIDVSYISSSLDLSKTLSLWCLTQAESRSQYSHLESLSRSCLKFRGGNDDRNGIYSSATEVIFSALSFVNPFHGAVAKKGGASHTRWYKMC